MIAKADQCWYLVVPGYVSGNSMTFALSMLPATFPPGNPGGSSGPNIVDPHIMSRWADFSASLLPRSWPRKGN